MAPPDLLPLLAAGLSAFPEELVLVIAAAVLVAVVLHWARLPVITGLLLAGALIGPSGFGFVEEGDQRIRMLSEIGLILLLFTIGLEFSLSKLVRAWRLVLIGGAVQALLTAAISAGIAVAAGAEFRVAVVIGMITVMSSTAIVLRGLTERGELDAPHGRFIVGVLIFQDLLVVPMMLTIPILANGGGQSPIVGLLKVAGLTIVVVAAVVLAARAIVPRLFAIVAATRSREVFVLTVVAVCTGTAWITGKAGLSLELGAFLAGLVLADSEFGNRAVGDMLPLRDVLTSVFFVSLGMLFNPQVIIDHPLLVFGILAALVLGKGFVATIAALAMRFPARVAWLAGVGLAQLSEFGFILAATAVATGMISQATIDPLLAAGVLSMFLTPLMIRVAPHVTAGERVVRPLERVLGVRGVDDDDLPETSHRDHVIVVGYGVGGRLIGSALREAGVPYIVMELDVAVVRSARDAGEHVYYGDASSVEALHHAKLSDARALVVMINDPIAAHRAVATARAAAPDVPILLRARYLNAGPGLLNAGASDVVFAEVETGAEMLARVLRHLEFPGNVIRTAVGKARDATQPSRSGRTLVIGRPVETMPTLTSDTCLLRRNAWAVGKSLRTLGLRSRTGALVAAIQRGEETIPNPAPDEPLRIDDLLVLIGREDAVVAAESLLEHGPHPDSGPVQPGS